MLYWSKKHRRREIFQRIFILEIFWRKMSRYAATPLIVALSPDHRFRPWSPIAPTGSHLDLSEIIPNFAQTTGSVDVFDRDPLSGELPCVKILMNDGSNPLTWDAQLLSYWFSRNKSGVLPRLARELIRLFWILLLIMWAVEMGIAWTEYHCLLQSKDVSDDLHRFATGNR
jgi:hypothetical protein